MKKKFINAFAEIQELFQELASQGKIAPDQASRFDKSQKDIINYHQWVSNQLEGNIKVNLPWDNPEFTKAWILWKNFKKEQFKFYYKTISEQGALKDLADLSGGDMNLAIEIIHQSIKKGWKGFFQIQQQNQNRKIEEQKLDAHKDSLFNRLTNQS